MKKSNLDIDPSSPYPFRKPVRLGRNIKEPDKCFNLVILGDSGVGKTRLLRRFADDVYADEEPIPTFRTRPVKPLAFRVRTITLQGEVIRLNIYHPKGAGRNDDSTAEQIGLADGIMVVYDMTNLESFTNIQLRWAIDIERYAKRDVKVILVGNKMDKCSTEDKHINKKINFQMAQRYADAKKWRFFEVSAKMARNVDDAFSTLTNCIIAIPLIRTGKILECLDIYTQLQPQPPEEISIAIAMMLQGDQPFEDGRKTAALIFMLLRGVPDCSTLQFFALQRLSGNEKAYHAPQSLTEFLGVDRIITLIDPPTPAAQITIVTRETETCAFYEEIALSPENPPLYKVPKGGAPSRGDLDSRFEARKLDLLNSLKSQYTGNAITERAIKYLSLPTTDHEANSEENTEMADVISQNLQIFKETLLRSLHEQPDKETLISFNSIIAATSALVNKLHPETVNNALIEYRNEITVKPGDSEGIVNQKPPRPEHYAALLLAEAIEECCAKFIKGPSP